MNSIGSTTQSRRSFVVSDMISLSWVEVCSSATGTLFLTCQEWWQCKPSLHQFFSVCANADLLSLSSVRWRSGFQCVCALVRWCLWWCCWSLVCWYWWFSQGYEDRSVLHLAKHQSVLVPMNATVCWQPFLLLSMILWSLWFGVARLQCHATLSSALVLSCVVSWTWFFLSSLLWDLALNGFVHCAAPINNQIKAIWVEVLWVLFCCVHAWHQHCAESVKDCFRHQWHQVFW